jgi:hypothetical protein
MMQVVIQQPSHIRHKKLEAVIDGKKTVPFGQKNASDFTLHKDPERKARYINRHEKREDWTKSGINTAGFYSKHVLWNKDTIQKSVNDLNKKYKSVNFILKS